MLRGNGEVLLRLTKSDDPLVSVADASEVLGCDENTLRVTVQQAPERLGFPTMRVGNRIKIPRIPFLKFMGVEV